MLPGVLSLDLPDRNQDSKTQIYGCHSMQSGGLTATGDARNMWPPGCFNKTGALKVIVRGMQWSPHILCRDIVNLAGTPER